MPRVLKRSAARSQPEPAVSCHPAPLHIVRAVYAKSRENVNRYLSHIALKKGGHFPNIFRHIETFIVSPLTPQPASGLRLSPTVSPFWRKPKSQQARFRVKPGMTKFAGDWGVGNGEFAVCNGKNPQSPFPIPPKGIAQAAQSAAGA